MNLGKAIRVCRIQRELSQKELAERARLSTAYVSHLERNERDPSLSTVESIADALNLPLSILVFLAADGEITSLSPALREKLSDAALSLMHEKTDPQANLPLWANQDD